MSFRFTLFAVAFVGLAPAVALAEEAKAKPLAIQLTLLDDEVIHGATFQSNNQKVVSNGRGIFAVYLKNRNKEYTAQQWRLVGRAKPGAAFRTIFEETAATNPPVLETDADDNLYVVRPDFVDRHAYLYRFLAKDDYREPVKTRIPRGSAGKYALVLDAHRKQLYYFAHNNSFHVVGLDGEVRSSFDLLKGGKNAVLQYPALCMGADHTLYAAWTTVAHEKRSYWDIHAIRSRDGGKQWEKLDGTALKLPIVADDTGAADRITLHDEFTVSTWLSNFLAVESKLHFIYMVNDTPLRQRYVRYDLKRGRKDHEITPKFAGEKLSLRGLDGFFSASSDGKALFCVMKDASANRLACLRSEDAGATWHDHAVSEVVKHPYATGGSRTLSRDGRISGTFTDVVEPSAEAKGKSKVYFFEIEAKRK